MELVPAAGVGHCLQGACASGETEAENYTFVGRKRKKKEKRERRSKISNQHMQQNNSVSVLEHPADFM